MVFMVKIPKSDGLIGLGERLAEIDKSLVQLLAYRSRVAVSVAAYKMATNQPLIRKRVERQRRAQWIRWAHENRMNPEFARTVFNVVLAEMCRIEIETKESGK